MTRGLSTALALVLGGTLLGGQAPQTTSPPPAAQLPPLPADVQPPGPAPGLTMVRMIRAAKPQYTRDAMLRRVQGEVTMRVVVNTDGSVSDVIIVRSLDPGLDQEALKAAQQFQFAPATKDGVPVRMAVNIVLEFNLRGLQQPAGEWPNGFTSNTRLSPLSQSTVTVGRATLTLQQLDGWAETPRRRPEVLLSWRHPRGWLITVEQTQPAAVAITDTLTTQQLDQLARSIAQPFGQVAPAISGQVKVEERPWIWVDMGREATLTPPPDTFPDGSAFKGAQRWAFATRAGDRNLVIRCSAYLPQNAAPADAQTQLADAAKEFRGIMQLVRLTEP
jgi:TonB family protein